MKTTLLASALALGAMTSAALAAEPAKLTPAQAGPTVLTTAQMDKVTAGQTTDFSLLGVLRVLVEEGSIVVRFPDLPEEAGDS